MKKKRKMIAPIMVACIFVLYFIGLAVLYFFMPGLPLAAKIALAVIPAALCGVMIGVTAERIKEIKEGE